MAFHGSRHQWLDQTYVRYRLDGEHVFVLSWVQSERAFARVRRREMAAVAYPLARRPVRVRPPLVSVPARPASIRPVSGSVGPVSGSVRPGTAVFRRRRAVALALLA